MRAVEVSSPGPAENLRLSESVPVPQPGSGQAQVRVAYTALNRADLLQRLGRYPPLPGESPIIGLEASGIVASVGEGVDWLSPGDRVAALLGGGGYAEVAVVDARHVLRLPAAVSLRSGAALPEAWLTAYQLLFLVGDMRPGDRVLVHAGASGVGSAAVQIVGAFGGVAYATAGTEEKCRRAEALGAVACFNYNDGDFADRLLGRVDAGVDVILDCVGTRHLAANLRCLATDARWVLYGLMGGASLDGGAQFLRQLLARRASVRATLLRNRSPEYKSRLVSEFSRHVLPLVASGQLQPVIHAEFPLSEAAAAHKLMEANGNIGKILLTVNAGLEPGNARLEL